MTGFHFFWCAITSYFAVLSAFEFRTNVFYVEHLYREQRSRRNKILFIDT